jgi:hypothetical protein
MRKMRRWLNSRREVVWTEPKLPPYVKINPDGEPDPDVALEPGDISMRAVTEEFLNAEEVPQEPLTLPCGRGRCFP